MKSALFALFLCVSSAPMLVAQVDVGYPPARSPFRDLPFRQEMTLFGGFLSTGSDPAGVAPRGGPLVGGRYEIVVGGPAQFVVRVAQAFTERTILDPTQPEATRDLGTRPWPIMLADIGMSLNVTGQRSFRGIVPVLFGGLGVASDMGRKAEEDPFRLGTTFAISVAGGLRFVPGGRLQIRADAGTYLYQIKYPTAYYLLAPDNSRVVDDSQDKNFWKSNPAITVGVSYLLFR